MYRCHPSNRNAFCRAGRPLVAKVPHLNGDYLPDSVDKAIGLLGGVEKAISSGDRVMIKPNFNCAFALPLSTDLAFLAAVIEILQSVGSRVSVGELTGGGPDWPPERVIAESRVLPLLKRYGVPFINFEQDDWIELQADGEYWDSFRVPRSIYEAEKRIYLANMRCHSSARYTASLKLSVGWIDLADRARLHEERDLVEFKIAELNLGWQPDLVLMDGRRSTVTSHGRGPYVYPNVVMASGDMVAIDAEAVKLLKQFPADNQLDISQSEMGQLKTAQDLGLGSMDYTLLEVPANTATLQKGLGRDYDFIKDK